MKIVLITPMLGYRGSERYVEVCADSYRAMPDVDVTVVCPEAGRGAVYESLARKGFSFRFYSSAADLTSIADDLCREQPLFVHLHRSGRYSSLYRDALRCLHAAHVPVVETNIFGELDYFTGGCLDVSLQISLWDLDRWNARKRYLPFVRRQFGIYLPYGVDTDVMVRSDENTVRAFRAKLNIPENAFVLGRAGKTRWDVLAPAVVAALEKHPEFHFVTLEDYSWNTDVLTKIPEELKQRVHVLPSMADRNEMALFYSVCTLFAATSGIGESFGYVIAEPMACGTPVLSLSVPNIDNAQSELICHGVNGFLAGSGKAYALLLERLVSNPSLVRDAARCCREAITGRYSYEIVKGMLEKLVGTVKTCRDDFSRRRFRRILKKSFVFRNRSSRLRVWRDVIRNSEGPYAFRPHLMLFFWWDSFACFCYLFLHIIYSEGKSMCSHLRQKSLWIVCRALTVCQKLRIWGLRGIYDFLIGKWEEKRLRDWFAANHRRNSIVHPRPKGVTLIGDFLGTYALSKTMRDLLFALKEARIPFQALQIGNGMSRIKSPEIESLLTRQADFCLTKYRDIFDMAAVPLPETDDLRHARLFFWEFESGMLEFDPRLSNARRVIGMSDFNVNYFKKVLPSDVEVRKLLYPFRFGEVVPSSRQTIRDKYGWNKNDFIVFFNFDYRSSFYRKNPDGAMRAFAQAFRDVPDARLVFKTNHAEQFPHEHSKLRELAEKLGISARFISIDRFLPISEVYGLTASCDVYLSLHRGEGFGLGIVEAMSLGCPVIVTNYSSNTEFCHSENAFLVPYKIMNVPFNTFDNPCYANVRFCAEPDIDTAVDILRRCYADRVMSASVGAHAKKFVHEYFGIENFRRSVESILS